jgi:glycogen synthase
MRILLWSSTFWPHIGGVEVLGARFVAALRERGHEVVVLARRDTDDLPAYGALDGAQIVRHRFRQPLERGDVEGIVAARRAVRELRSRFAPDVVHLYHLGPDVLFHELTRDAHPAPTVVTLHQPFTGELLRSDVALGRALRDADWIAACSASVLSAARRQIPAIGARSSVVLNRLPPPGVQSKPLPTEPPAVLLVGRIVPQKGFDLGIEAFARVREQRPECRLVIAGDGVERHALEHKAEALGLNGAVEFTGWIHPRDVPALINRATVVAMPSRFEPFGLVALEAAQMRRPVVGFAVDGLAEAVAHGETGILVEPGHVDALASAILSLIDQPALAETLGDAGWARASRRTGWNTHVEAYERIYERVTDGR